MARKLVGIVKSAAQDKTIVIIVRTQKTHPIYRKQFTASKNFQVHDENNEARVNDKVEVVETRPISKTKKFKLVRILEAAQTVESTAAKESK